MAPVPADPPSGVDQGTTPLGMEVPGDHDHVAGSSRSAIELESGRLAEAKVRRRGRGTYVRPILPAMAQATRYSVDDLMEYTKGCLMLFQHEMPPSRRSRMRVTTSRNGKQTGSSEA